MRAFRTVLAVAALISSGCSTATTRAVLGTYGGAAILGTEAIAFSGGVPQTTPTILAETAIVTTGVVAILVAVHLMDPETSFGSLASGGGGGGGGDDLASSSAAPNAPSAANPSAGPAGHAVYDRNGAFAGHTDAQGNTYDANGTFAGHTDALGNTYNSAGAYDGRVDGLQNYYDRNGAYAGRLDPTGNIYDKNGASDGRIDSNGNIYDKNGAFAGRVDGSCDDACKQATAARVLHP
jgi:hypothetical protein